MSKDWLKAALIRAIRTFAQNLAASITLSAAFSEINWKYAISVAGVSAVYSLCMSIAGLPEVDNGKKE